jgi:hypothetical protein
MKGLGPGSVDVGGDDEDGRVRGEGSDNQVDFKTGELERTNRECLYMRTERKTREENKRIGETRMT